MSEDKIVIGGGTPVETMEEVERKHNELLKWARSLTKDQIEFLCNGGWYNDTIKGYLIEAANNAGMDREQIHKLLDGLNWAFSDKTMQDAAEIYDSFI